MNRGQIIVTDQDFWRLNALVSARTAEPTRDQAHIEELQEELARSAPVALSRVPVDVVTMHSQVHVRDLATGIARTYTLVFPHEANIESGRLSVLAPLGTALLGYRVSDEIEWAMPGGVRRVRIEGVRQARVPRARRRMASAAKPRRRLRRETTLMPLDGVA